MLVEARHDSTKVARTAAVTPKLPAAPTGHTHLRHHRAIFAVMHSGVLAQRCGNVLDWSETEGGHERQISTKGEFFRGSSEFCAESRERSYLDIVGLGIGACCGEPRMDQLEQAAMPLASRSRPCPAIPVDAVPIWSRRPNANTLARTHEILWGMMAWLAPQKTGGSATGLSATGA